MDEELYRRVKVLEEQVSSITLVLNELIEKNYPKDFVMKIDKLAKDGELQ